MSTKRNKTGKSSLQNKLLSILVVGLVCLVWAFPHPSAPPPARAGMVYVHIIDVGQGNSILIVAPQKIVMIDFGEKDMGTKVVRYLDELGIQKIDLLVESHPHDDHYGGMEAVVRHVITEAALMPDVKQDLIPKDKAYISLQKAIEEKNIQIQTAFTGLQYALGADANLTVLGPSKRQEDPNNSSLVIRLDFGEASFLFPGDIESSAETLLENTADIDVDVLMVAHHGSNTSTDQTFLKRCTPMVAAISVGEGNSYGHPHPLLVNRLSSYGPIYRTDINGNIVFSTDGQKITVTTQHGNSEVLDAAS